MKKFPEIKTINVCGNTCHVVNIEGFKGNPEQCTSVILFKGNKYIGLKEYLTICLGMSNISEVDYSVFKEHPYIRITFSGDLQGEYITFLCQYGKVKICPTTEDDNYSGRSYPAIFVDVVF